MRLGFVTMHAVIVYGLACQPMSSDLSAQTLDAALTSTFRVNATLKAGRAELEATQALVSEAAGGWLPTLALESDVTGRVVDIGKEDDPILSSKAALVLEQNLYKGGETTADLRRTRSLARAQAAALDALEQDVFLGVVEAYADVVNDAAILDLATANQAILKQQLDAARRRAEAGRLTRTDIAQSEARYEGSIAERDRALGNLEVSKTVFSNLAGLEPTTITAMPAASLALNSQAETIDLAMTENPEIANHLHRLAAAEAEIELARAALRPSFDLQAELGYEEEVGLNADTLDDDDGLQAAIGFELRIPLYQGGTDRARIRRAEQTRNQVGYELDAVKAKVRTDASRAFQDLRAARVRLGALERQAKAARIAIDGARKEAAVGQRSTLDVLDLESDLFDAEVDLATARRDEVVASYQMRRAVGSLTAKRLGLTAEP